MTAERDAARKEFSRIKVEVLGLHIDRCQNDYGVAPCAAAGAVGSECYKTYNTCDDKPNYNRGTEIYKYISRGAPLPPGENIRPYISKITGAPTEANPENAFGRRAYYQITLVDEVDNDIGVDPYRSTRTVEPSGTYWGRWLARNPNYQNRFAVISKGYVVNGVWDWNTFQDELYSIEKIKDQDSQGNVVITIQDPMTRTDYIKLPVPTSGKLLVELKDYEDQGTAQGGSINTIVLQAEASAVDDFYNGMAVRITDQTGAGQEGKILSYVGATRTATVVTDWAVSPDATSIYFIQELKITLQEGAGSEYSKYGVPGYIRIGEEAIKFTDITGDVLSWVDTTHRTQFNTPIDSHRVDSKVQVGKYFDDELFTDVYKWLLNECGIDDAYIDLAGNTEIENTWLGVHYRISAPLFVPEKASDLLVDLLKHGPCLSWWDVLDQKQKLIYYGPPPPGEAEITWSDEIEFIGLPTVETLDELRITSAAISYSLTNATANRKEDKNYEEGEIYIDGDASGPNEYDGDRFKQFYSRFFHSNNQRAAYSWASLQVAHYRDAPKKIECKIEPRDYDFKIGDFRNIETSKIADKTGRTKKVKVIITKINDIGSHIDVEGRTTIFNRRFAFFAPVGTAPYPDNNGFGCFSQNDELMPDGTSAYLFY